jgi:hypothetical protein
MKCDKGRKLRVMNCIENVGKIEQLIIDNNFIARIHRHVCTRREERAYKNVSIASK